MTLTKEYGRLRGQDIYTDVKLFSALYVNTFCTLRADCMTKEFFFKSRLWSNLGLATLHLNLVRTTKVEPK